MAVKTIPEHPVNTKPAPSPLPSWADKPFPLLPSPFLQTPHNELHGAEVMAHDMSHIHNIILRCLNALYLQAPYVKAAVDKKDYIACVGHMIDFIHHHHEAEEKYFFLELEKFCDEISMEGNVEEHRAFDAALSDIENWQKNATPTTYDGDEAQKLLFALGSVLQPHLAHEIQTLLALRKYDSEALRKIWVKSGEYARSFGDMKVQLPIVAGNVDVTYEGKAVTELVLPFVAALMCSLVLSRKHAGAWRFLPCDFYGKPRPLAFGPGSEDSEKRDSVVA